MVLSNYLSVAKPGIIAGNLVTLAGGFFLASRGEVDFRLLLATTLGLALVVASGCVFNNVIDRDIDGKMQRTRNRVLVRGAMSPQAALLYAAVLGVAGFGLMSVATNPLATLIVALGFVVYVGVYSLYFKRHSVYGTLIGSLSGAAPPLVGYCAVTGSFDFGALVLLLIFSLWQMPHFYAIAIFRLQDYRAAGIPVLPAVEGVPTAKKHIVFYVGAFLAATLALSLGRYTGPGFLAVATVLGGYWLHLAWSGRTAFDDIAWARRLFFFSLVIVMAISVTMSVDYNSQIESQAPFHAWYR
jgi:protoheme IX farnesyltransferase